LRAYGGNLRQPAERYGIPEEEIVDFSANMHPLRSPPAVLVKLGKGPEAKELQDLPGRKRILIRNGDGFRFLGPKLFRVAVRTRPENQKLIRALSQILGGN
jgi:histidinol-phosphate/aromatic aminotransferase/cobyric acid decarboxylase-like protein